MTRFVSIPIALFCALALFVLLVFIGCGGPQGNGAGTGNGNTKATPKSTLTVDCKTGNPSNEAIVQAIYDAIGASIYKDEVKQFNITAKRPDVFIVGWSDHKADIENLVGGAAKGCDIKDANFADGKGNLGADYKQRIGCPPDWGICGDICIPPGEPCKANNGPGQPPSWKCTEAPTPTPTPLPTPKPSAT